MKKGVVLIKVNERLVLRQYQPSEASRIFSLIDENRGHIQKFDENWTEKYLNAKDLLDRIVSGTGKNRRFHFGIWHDDTIVGNVNFVRQEYDAVIGYWLGEKFQGHGYASLAVGALAEKLFASGKISQLRAKTNKNNQKSLRLLNFLGFEGCGKEKDDIFFVLKKWLPFWIDILTGYGLMQTRNIWGIFLKNRSLSPSGLLHLKQSSIARFKDCPNYGYPDFGEGAFYDSLPTLGQWTKNHSITL